MDETVLPDRRAWASIAVVVTIAALAAACIGSDSKVPVSRTGSTDPVSRTGIHKIQHVVMIMQENRSFDSYFGTYPGADGSPSGVCMPDPLNGGCVKPFHDAEDKNFGGPHGPGSAINDIDGGRMDG